MDLTSIQIPGYQLQFLPLAYLENSVHQQILLAILPKWPSVLPFSISLVYHYFSLKSLSIIPSECKSDQEILMLKTQNKQTNKQHPPPRKKEKKSFLWIVIAFQLQQTSYLVTWVLDCVTSVFPPPASLSISLYLPPIHASLLFLWTSQVHPHFRTFCICILFA